jgi:hypothetical protein
MPLAPSPVFCHSPSRRNRLIRVNRFFKTAVVLVVSLFALVSGVDAGLDQLSRSASLSNCTFYNEKGEVVAAYTGDLNLRKPIIKHGFSFSEFRFVPRS